MKQYIPLGNVISKASVERCGKRQLPILSITMRDGLVMQDEKFKKRIASADTADYKVIPRGKLVQGIHIDEANFGIQDIVDEGIVSPAYKVWDVESSVIYPKYLELIMRSPRSLAFYKSKLNGSVNRRGRMTDDDFLGMLIPFTEYSQQKRIVSIIDQITSVIALYQHQLRALDTLIKARFVEMFGDMADPDCEWPDCKLIEVCDENDDIKCGPFGTQLSKDEYQESGIPVWEIPQINSAFAIPPEHFVTAEKAEQLRAYSLSAGDIVMSRKGNVGKCAIFPADKPNGILHSDVLRIRVSNKKANPCFIMCQLHFSRDIIRQIEMVSSGAIMAGVNVTKLKEIIVKLPPLDIQCQFAFFVSQVDKSKVVVQAALDKAQMLFDSLMQECFG